MIEVPHDHCPCGCEHPQPFQAADSPDVPEQYRGRWLCGRCWHESQALCVMIRCTPEVCA